MTARPQIHVSAVALSDPDGRLAVVRKRGTESFMFPGGKPEPGEAPADCAVRECAEELGIDLIADELIPLGRHEADAANEAGHLVVAEVFVGLTRERPSPRAEIDDLRWFQPSDPPSDIRLAPLTLALLPRLRERIASGNS